MEHDKLQLELLKLEEEKLEQMMLVKQIEHKMLKLMLDDIRDDIKELSE